MRHVHRRAQIAVEALHLGECKGVIEGSKVCRRKALRNEREHGRRFGQDAARRHQ